MRKLLLLSFFISFFIVVPAAIGCWADSIVDVSLGGSSTCRFNCSAGLTESVFATFRFDTVTFSILPGTISVSSVGPIQDNLFSFVSFSMSAPGQPEFDFRNASADIFQLTLFPAGSPSFPGAMFPDPGVYFGNANVICGLAADDCSHYGFDGLNLARTQGTVVAVPEPDEWTLLMASGLFGLGLAFRRRVHTLWPS
jgi:hypothetical protein